MNVKNVIISSDITKNLETAITAKEYDRIFILTDESTYRFCRPMINGTACLSRATDIIIGATDENKTLDSLASVWTRLSNEGASRHSLLINLGGGMVTDLGGFAASTFKRGIAYINIPTTLLAMVDASVGGKTGINFNGLKNEVGVFSASECVILDTRFLRTLDMGNKCSGYAEMLKHGLISNIEHWKELMDFDILADESCFGYEQLARMVGESVKIKERIVTEDPYEKGIRKALNFGHTAGHAVESLALMKHKPVLHGYAVAWGMICELYLSCVKSGFPTDIMRQTTNFIKECYGFADIECNDYEALYKFMTHDKKNSGDTINFTLLGDIGDIKINQSATKNEIFEMLDFYRDGIS